MRGNIARRGCVDEMLEAVERCRTNRRFARMIIVEPVQLGGRIALERKSMAIGKGNLGRRMPPY